MKWDHFYKGLNPEYWQMLANKVDSENFAWYSNLCLAAWKLERWLEARDPLLLKNHPNQGIKHNSFSDISELVTLLEVEGQSYLHHLISYGGKLWNCRRVRHKGRGGRRCWDFRWRGPRNLKWDWWSRSAIGYIIHFVNVVEVYLRKNQNWFACSSPDHLVKYCWKDLRKTTWKARLNGKEGMMKKGGQTLQKAGVAQLVSQDKERRT